MPFGSLARASLRSPSLSDARFEVFWPVIVGWGILFLDVLRERALHTFSIEVDTSPFPPDDGTERPVTVFADPKGGKPATIQLLLDRPAAFALSAGQWCYVKVNSIDRVWHPFSIASASADRTVRLYVGVRQGAGWEKSQKGSWVQPASSATWTYKLLDAIRTGANLNSPPIPLQIRGPYGSPFTKCFDPKFGAAVLIGAGTGLASALSVLMEVIQRRGVARSPGPRKVWFVWSCRNEQQLDWCWRALLTTLLQAWEKGKLNPEETWNPITSNMIDWLGVTIYVSQSSTAELLEHFKEIDSDVKQTVADAAAPSPVFGVDQCQIGALSGVGHDRSNDDGTPQPSPAYHAPPRFDSSGSGSGDVALSAPMPRVEIQVPSGAAWNVQAVGIDDSDDSDDGDCKALDTVFLIRRSEPAGMDHHVSPVVVGPLCLPDPPLVGIRWCNGWLTRACPPVATLASL